MRRRLWWVVGTVALSAVLGGCDSDLETFSKKVEQLVGAKEEKAAKEPAPAKKKERQEQARRAEGGQGAVGGSGPAEEPAAESSSSPRHFAREWFVSPSGADQAEGSRQKPFRTINRAIAAAGPGEAIRVQAGEYPESVAIDGKAQKGRKDAPITLLGEGQPKIVPGKSSGALLQVRRPFWIIDGFELDVRGQPRFAALFEGDTQGSTLRRSHLHGGTLGGGVTTYGNARGVLIERNHIHDFRKPHADSHGVVVQATSRDIVIRNNDIHDTSGDAVQCLNPDSASQKPAEGVVIERNRLYSTGENGVDIKTCRNVVVRHNRMSGFRKSPTSSGEAVVVHYSARDVRIEDNDISQAGKGIAVGGVTQGANPAGIVVKGNHIQDISTAGGSDGAGIRVENSTQVQLENNTIENTEGYGMMLGLGANGAPSRDLMVKDNVIRTQKLVRLGRQRPGLRMGSNRYEAGGMFKAEPQETRDFSQWKQLSGVDQGSRVEP
jgi:nitrous oxidase accessory protein NosD